MIARLMAVVILLVALTGCDRSPKWVLWVYKSGFQAHSEHRTLAECQEADKGDDLDSPLSTRHTLRPKVCAYGGQAAMSISRFLVVLLCLLALATSASAECGWVLWSGFLGADLHWFTNTAYQTHGECLAGMERMVQLSRRAGADVTWAQGQPSATWKETTGARGVYQCLPDTVDPGGPKEK